MSRVGNLLAIIVLALALQGCLVEYKEVIDVYPAISGLQAGETLKLFDWIYRGESFCFQPDTRFAFEGRLGQRFPEGAFLLIIAHLLADGGARELVLRHRAPIRKNGTIPERIVNFPAFCMGDGDRLQVSARSSHNIDPNVSLWSRAIVGTRAAW